jgi:hypothetical protein
VNAMGMATLAWAATLVLVVGSVRGDEPKKPAASDGTRALAPLQVCVGSWRGVGQPKRGSNQGAWTEECDFEWQFPETGAQLVAHLRGNPYYSLLRFKPGMADGQYVLEAVPLESNAEAQRFDGRRDNGAFVFAAQNRQEERPARISFRLAAGGDRLLILFEKPQGASLVRLAEVGATRRGSSFAKNARSGPECIVTGGLGTIAVEYKGKKYFVCCSGCRDYFLENAETVLAERAAK